MNAGALRDAGRLPGVLEPLESRQLFSALPGSELLVNETTLGIQASLSAGAVASSDDGSFVSVWSGAGTGDAAGVFARVFDADGFALTDEFRVNEGVLGVQDQASVAMDADGNFVVTWTDHGLLFPAIMMRTFDADGVAQMGETLVDANLLFPLANSSVAMDDAGNYVVAWQSDGEDALFSDGVFAQRYSAAGIAQGGRFQVNDLSLGHQGMPSVAMDADGDFVIAFSGRGAGDSTGVFFNRYNASGVLQGGEVRVNTTTAGVQYGARVGMDDAGHFVVAWSGEGVGDSSGIHLQRYNASGVALGGETLVNTTTSGNQEDVAVSVHGTGVFAVAWSGDGPDDSSGVYARQYDAAGGTLVGETRFNTTTVGIQTAPSIAHHDTGFVVQWSGEGIADEAGVYVHGYPASGRVEQLVNETTLGVQAALTAQAVASNDSGLTVAVWAGSGTGDAAGVFARLFDADGTALTGEFRANESLLGVQDQASVAMDADGNFVVTWTDHGLLFPAIMMRTFDANGIALTGETLVDVNLLFPLTNSSVAMDDDGNFVVAWQSDGEDALLSDGVFAQRFNAAGVAQGPRFQVNNMSLNHQGSPAVAMDADGGFVIAFTGDGAGDLVGVFAQRYDASGAEVGGEFLVNTTTVGFQIDPSVGIDDAGNFVIAWAGNGTGDNDGVFFQRYDAQGNAVGGETRANTTTAGDQEDVALAMNSDGFFSIAWSGNGPDDGDGVFVQQYDAAGNAILAETRVPTTLTDTQTAPSITQAHGNGVTLVWSGEGIADEAGVYMHAFANTLPTIAATGGTLAYTEGDGAVVIDAGLTVAHSGGVNLSGATVSITLGFVAGEDVLGFVDQLGITGSYDAGAGVLTLSGTASIADYQAALRTVTYANTSEAPTSDPRVISTAVTDGTSAGPPARRGVQVTAENDTGAVTATSGTLAYSEGDGAVLVDAGLTVTDPDSTTLVGATVAITTGFMAGEDALGFVDQFGITGSYNAGSGVLTLSGVASVADYQSALRSVTYNNTSETPTTDPRVVSMSVNDGSTDGSPATRGLQVSATNDPPTVGATAGTLGYTEGVGAVVIDAGLSVADVDDTVLEGAIVAITTGFMTGEDVLGFTDQMGITGSFDATTGVLTLSGVASVADYQTALRSVTYTNTSDDPSTDPRTLSFTADDGTSSSPPATRGLQVSASNDAPVVTATPGTLAYTEGDGVTVIDAGLAVSDPDDASLSSATVAITTGFVAGEDVLSFVDQSGITGSYNASTGVLALSGTASVADYQAALRTVTYTNTSDTPTTDPRTVSTVVNDGTTNSAPGSRGLQVTASNDAPVVTATPGTLNYTEGDGAVAVDAGLAVSDADHSTLAGATVAITTGFATGQDVLGFTDQLGITGSYNAGTGVLTLSGFASVADYQTALRSVTYTNTSDDPSTNPRTLRFNADDGTAASAPATRGLQVSATNDAPAVASTVGTLNYTEGDGAVAVDAGLTVADPDTATLTGATVAITTGFVSGEDVLGFADQSGITGSYDAAAGVLTLSGVASVADYQAALRTVTYTNTSDDPATDPRVISFIANDGTAIGAPATRGLQVSSANDAPAVVAAPGTTTFIEGGGAVVIDAGLAVSDADTPTLASATVVITTGFVVGEDVLGFTDQLGITGSYDGATGVLTLSGVASVADYQAALRTVTYINTSEDPTTDARIVSFTTHDGAASSPPVTRGLQVNAANDAPTVVTSSGTLSYTEGDGAAVIDAGLSVVDVDNADLAVATVSITTGFAAGEDVLGFVDQMGITGNYNATTGVLTLSGTASVADYQAALRSVMYSNTSDTPSTDPREVSFAVDDGTAASAPSARGLQVGATNDAPAVTATPGTLVYTESTGAQAIDTGLTVSDADNTTLAGASVAITVGFVSGEDVLGFADQLGITGSFDGTTGVLTLTGNTTLANYQAALRTVTYTNTSDDPNTDPRVISTTVNDGVSDSAAATRGLQVTAVNDTATATATPGTLSYTEGDGAVLVDGGLSVSDLDDANLAGATVAITTGFVAGEDVLGFVDQSGITGSYNAGTGVLTLSGSASLTDYQTALRSVTYTNTSDDPTTDPRVISTTLDDGTASGTPATRGLQLASVNDAPMISTTAGAENFTEDAGAVIIDATLIVADPDSSTLTGATVAISGGFVAGEDVLGFVDQSGITGSYNTGTGVLSLTGNASVADYQAALRSVTYANLNDNPDTDPRTIRFSVDDGTAASAPATRGVQVTSVNDAATVTGTPGTLSYTEGDGAVVVDAGLVVSDADDTTLTGATVSISAGYVAGEDVLGFVDQLGISGSYDAAAGVLTLTGNASVVDYQAALRSVTYTNISADLATGPRVIRTAVHDGTASGSPATRGLQVMGLGDDGAGDISSDLDTLLALSQLYQSGTSTTYDLSTELASDDEPDRPGLSAPIVFLFNSYSLVVSGGSVSTSASLPPLPLPDGGVGGGGFDRGGGSGDASSQPLSSDQSDAGGAEGSSNDEPGTAEIADADERETEPGAEPVENEPDPGEGPPVVVEAEPRPASDSPVTAEGDNPAEVANAGELPAGSSAGLADGDTGDASAQALAQRPAIGWMHRTFGTELPGHAFGDRPETINRRPVIDIIHTPPAPAANTSRGIDMSQPRQVVQTTAVGTAFAASSIYLAHTMAAAAAAKKSSTLLGLLQGFDLLDFFGGEAD